MAWVAREVVARLGGEHLEGAQVQQRAPLEVLLPGAPGPQEARRAGFGPERS